MPTTEDKSPNVPISFNRTSGLSSLMSIRKTLIKWSTVIFAPKIGARLKTEPARDARTFWDCSRGSVSFSIATTKSLMNSGLLSTAATAVILVAAMARTSTSWSDNNCKYCGITADTAVSSKTSQICFTLSAIMYRTRQDLSSEQDFTTGRIRECRSPTAFNFPRTMQLLIARMRTESCSSLASFVNTWKISSSSDFSCTTSAILPSTLAACRRTIGVSSPHSLTYAFRRSSLCLESCTLGRAAANRPQTVIRDVNQSWAANRLMRAHMCRTVCSGVIFADKFLSDSVAFSLTEISSTLQSSSNGPKSVWA
mmetsp:Transcript_25595/g.41036  ORF Transcript_25595/g.41036 Transcript_25595/m.41036 type:complete len:311 (+) Transcript_25595:595-1527(+)